MNRKIAYLLLLFLSLLTACSSESKESFIFGPTPGDRVAEEIDTE